MRRFNESPVERAKRELGSMRDLLANHGHQVRGQNVRCPSPDHADRHPSASVYDARDGGERVHCFSCNFDGDVIDVARSLGMKVELGTAEPKVRSHRSPLRPISRGEAKMLVGRPDFAFEWIVAITLARIPEPLAQRDLLASWDFLADWVDIPFVVALSRAVRGTAFLRYGSTRDLDVRQAVDRLIREVAT
jgi:hypothetical protein